MKLSWNSLLDINSQNIILHSKVSDTCPRVTIGLPTYRRGPFIRRCLASIASQSYRNFLLVISDNNGADAETISAVNEFISSFPQVILIAQEINIGALNNLKFLLAISTTEYFMWLADDDEITPNYLEELVSLLDSDPSAVTAMGNWIAMISPNQGSVQFQSRLNNKNRLLRLLEFVSGNANDSGFYGLHRTFYLRQCSFSSYLPPNHGILTNFCYLILYDLLLNGHFQYSNSATWIYHDYSTKQYRRALPVGLLCRAQTLLRRLNIYLLYILKTARKAPFLTPFILVASCFGLLRDIATFILRLSSRLVLHLDSSRS